MEINHEESKATFDYKDVLDLNVRGMSCFIAQHFYDNREDAIDIDLEAIDTAYKQTMSGNIIPKVEPEAANTATIKIKLHATKVEHHQLRNQLKNKLNLKFGRQEQTRWQLYQLPKRLRPEEVRY